MSPILVRSCVLAVFVLGGCAGQPTARQAVSAPDTAVASADAGADRYLEEILATGQALDQPVDVPATSWTYPEITPHSTNRATDNRWVSPGGYSGCAPGVPYQSPIMIIPSVTTPSSSSFSGLSPVGYTMTLTKWAHDNSYAFELTGTPPTMRFAGIAVTPTVFHLHVPVEHFVYGTAPTAMEMHIKARAVSGSAVYTFVFAVPFVLKPGIPASWMSPVAAALVIPPPSPAPTLNLGQFLNRFQTQLSYSYVGSLTTPPCTVSPRVTWFVLQQAVEVDNASLSTISHALNTLNQGVANIRLPQSFDTSGIRYRSLAVILPSL